MAEAAVYMAAAAILTFIVTSIGTFFIWRQVTLTRQAVEDTSEATDAMREANRIATSTADAELRPWLEIAPTGESYGLGEHLAILNFKLNIRNIGRTPATNVRWQASLFNHATGYEKELEAFFESEFKGGGHPRAILPQGTIELRVNAGTRRENVQIITAGDETFVRPILAVRVVYEWPSGSGHTGSAWIAFRSFDATRRGWHTFKVGQNGEASSHTCVFQPSLSDNIT